MTTPEPLSEQEAQKQLQQAALDALRLVTLCLPHLAGLAASVRLCASTAIRTAGVFASGRVILNPEWFLSMSLKERAYVLAHELLHLALFTHSRSEGHDTRTFNIAHDYIINDMLSDVFCMMPPSNGLTWKGAKNLSLEELAQGILHNTTPARLCNSWHNTTHTISGLGSNGTPNNSMLNAMRKAGLAPAEQKEKIPSSAGQLDVMSDATEIEMFPKESLSAQALAKKKIVEAACLCNALRDFKENLDACKLRGTTPGRESSYVEALQTSFSPPWDQCLQRWIDGNAPEQRSYAKPSRRGQFSDVIRVGRQHSGFILNILLDTSGSMSNDLAYILGLIGSYCESVGCTAVRLLECDTEVTHDAIVHPSELTCYELHGFGGSDLIPAFDYFEQDPTIESAIVITDGYIDFPGTIPSFSVLWLITPGGATEFSPGYGSVIYCPESWS